jgi:hypothetical protein
MAGVLVTNSTVTCGHSGNVTVTSTQKLKVSNSPVLIKTSIENQSIPDCLTAPASDASGPTAKPCKTVSSVGSGEATKLKVNGQAVMLDTLSGATDGMVTKVTPQLLLSATAGHTKLTAI